MTPLQCSAVAAAAAALLASSAFAQAPAPAPVDPNAFVNQFESTFGKYEGYRRSGAKGICATGEFVGSADARALSTASAFSGKPVPVEIRFSVGGANPKAPDNAKSQRNMALQFDLPDGERWQMGNISAPVFGASSPQQFLGRLDVAAARPGDEDAQCRQGQGLRRRQPRSAAAGQALRVATGAGKLRHGQLLGRARLRLRQRRRHQAVRQMDLRAGGRCPGR